MQLVLTTFRLNNNNPVKVDLRITNAAGTRFPQQTSSTSLYQLRAAVFHTWEHFARSSDSTVACPQTWVDGKGEVVDVVKAEEETHTVEEMRGDEPEYYLTSRYTAVPKMNAPAYKKFGYLQVLYRLGPDGIPW